MNAKATALKLVEDADKEARQDPSRKWAPLTDAEKQQLYNQYVTTIIGSPNAGGLGGQGYTPLGTGSNLPRITPAGIIQPK